MDETKPSQPDPHTSVNPTLVEASNLDEASQIKNEDVVTKKDEEHSESLPTKNPSNNSEDEHKNNNSSLSTTEAPYMDEANLHYENDICIYTEPETKNQFIWNNEKQEWVPRSAPSDKDYEYDGKTYSYTDKETKMKYLWDDVKNEWNVDEKNKTEDDLDEKKTGEKKSKDEEEKLKEVVKQDMTKGNYSWENGTHIYTDPSDGSKYFWDKDKNAWIPKVDDDFLAHYQMNYGFVDSKENETKDEKKQDETPAQPPVDPVKRKAPQEPAWFDVGEESTKVYVSGLPLDVTETEFVDTMQKCGLVMRDVDTGNMKVKIYLDPKTSLPKGDALCTYIKKESVDLALDLIDGSELRGHRLTVERARFTMKGDAYDPSLKPKKRRKKDKEKIKKMQEKLLDWRPDKLRGERSKHEKTVIVKNLFDPADFSKDVKLILEYQQDLRDECLKCGGVKKVIIYDRHPEGVAQVNFKEFEAADACVQLLNGRWFGQRKITAELWDGKTKYKINETDEQIKARLEKWEKFLETGEAVDNNLKTDSTEVEKRDKENVEEKNMKNKDANVPKVKSDASLEGEGNVKMEADDNDSDGNTRSSVGSEYDTDEEVSKKE